MKSLFTVVATVLILCSGVSYSQEWQQQNPYPTSQNLRGIYFVDANTGTTIGSLGVILRTTNGGTNWEAQASGTTEQLNKVFFADVNTGTIVGNSGTILRTTEGGNSWTPQTSGTTQVLNAVFFTDANTGIVVGNSGTILRTTNGGNSWTSQTSGTTQVLNAVFFTNANTGIVVGNSGTIRQTTDGGVNWNAQTSGTTQALNAVFFTNANTGIVVGNSGTIRQTTDGGVNWNAQTSGTTQVLNAVFFTDADTGIVVGNSGTIRHTTDGGVNWNAQTSGITQPLLSVSFTNANTGIVVGNIANGIATILKTTNGGNIWINQASSVTIANLRGVSFIDTNNGTAVGASGTILRTTNGGSNWVIQTSGTTQQLNKVFFTDANTGTVIGNGGTILRTTNGGVNWTPQTSGTTLGLIGAFFTDVNIGTVVGVSGTILRTTDGGENWVSQSSGTIQALWGITFADANATTGYICGQGAVLLKTTNSGANWVAQTSGTGQALNGVFFANANTGTVIGNGGTILRTTNGGVNWNAQTSGTTQNLNGLSFTDANTGTAVGNSGIIRHTTNGGVNWNAQTSRTTGLLFGVSFVDANNGMAVGDLGIILRYSDNPPPPVNPNYGSNGQAGDNLYFFSNSSAGASGAPSQPVFSWADTTGSIDLYANGSNQASGIFVGDNNDGRWSILGQLGGGNIRFFGTDYTNVYIGNNGIIGFNTYNQASPNSHEPPLGGLNQANVTEAIFPLWVDMNIGYTGVAGRRISYKVTATELIVTYTRVPVYAPAAFTNDPDRYVSFQVIINFNNLSPAQNSKIFVSFDDSQSGSLFIDEVNNETLRTHLIGLQSANIPQQFLQYRYFSGPGLFINDGPIFSSPLTVAFGPDENTLPVELSSFTASVDKQDVYLSWTTVNEINNSGFDIERSSTTGGVKDETSNEWSKIAFIDGSGTTNEARNYTFTDRGLNTGKYNYRLKQIDYNGNFEYFNLSNEVVVGIPAKYNLSQNYPNPFNPVTKINFEIPVEGLTKLMVYDISGREVAVLVNEVMIPGYYTVDFNGVSLSSGVYFYRLVTRNTVITKKMLLIK